MDAVRVEARPDVPGWDLNPPWHVEPDTFQRGPLTNRGDPRAPEYGAGYEESAGEPRVARHELTFGYHTEGGWSEDSLSGVHGVLPSFEGDHYGYQEPWGTETSIDRNAPDLAWDAGISVGPGGI